MTKHHGYCFNCNQTILYNVYKAYDKNFCSEKCRNTCMDKYYFTSNFQLKSKSDKKLIKKSISLNNLNTYVSNNDGQLKIEYIKNVTNKINTFVDLSSYQHYSPIKYASCHKYIDFINKIVYYFTATKL